MSGASIIHIDLNSGKHLYQPIQVGIFSRKIKELPIYRVVAEPAMFVQKGVAGMVVDGAMTVYWNTGLASEAILYYGYFNADNLIRVDITNKQRYHSFVFPETYVDTRHFFKVISVNPITGKKIESETFSVYMQSDVKVRAQTVYRTLSKRDEFIISATHATNIDLGIDLNIGTGVPFSSDTLDVKQSSEKITILDAPEASSFVMETSITTTIS